jgi:hypothetical protein
MRHYGRLRRHASPTMCSWTRRAGGLLEVLDDWPSAPRASCRAGPFERARRGLRCSVIEARRALRRRFLLNRAASPALGRGPPGGYVRHSISASAPGSGCGGRPGASRSANEPVGDRNVDAGAFVVPSAPGRTGGRRHDPSPR